jgi:hypothetical protein
LHTLYESFSQKTTRLAGRVSIEHPLSLAHTPNPRFQPITPSALCLIRILDIRIQTRHLSRAMFRTARQIMHLQAQKPQAVTPTTVPAVETVCKGSRGIDCLVLAKDGRAASADRKAYLSKFPGYRYTLRQPWASPNYFAQWTKCLESHDSHKHVRLHYEIISLPTADAPGVIQILGQHWHKANDCPICNEEKVWDTQALIARCEEMGLDPFTKGVARRKVKPAASR